MAGKDIFTEEREKKILKLLNEKRRITVPELAEMFDTSSATIRKQLNILESKGKLMRTHGGALSIEEATYEKPLETKKTVMMNEKRMIAAEARKMINDGDVIILGGGTTVLELAKLLHDVDSLVVITDSIPAAAELYPDKKIELQVCGGTVRDKTGVVVGPQSEKYISELFADKTFIGADSISIEHGITTPNYFEAQIEKRLVERADKVIVLADHSKMDKVTLAKQTQLKDINYIITDSGIRTDLIDILQTTGVKVIIASGKLP